MSTISLYPFQNSWLLTLHFNNTNQQFINAAEKFPPPPNLHNLFLLIIQCLFNISNNLSALFNIQSRLAGDFQQIFLRGISAAGRRYFMLGFIGRARYIVKRRQLVAVQLLVEKEGKILAVVVLVAVKYVEHILPKAS